MDEFERAERGYVHAYWGFIVTGFGTGIVIGTVMTPATWLGLMCSFMMGFSLCGAFAASMLRRTLIAARMMQISFQSVVDQQMEAMAIMARERDEAIDRAPLAPDVPPSPRMH